MPAAHDHGRPTAESSEIQGAFGTIREHDVGARVGARARLLTLLAILGPGLIVTVGDNDAGGLTTYAQAGQGYGLTLLWTLLLCIPVLIVNQEMVARLGAVTGVGHAKLITERFGRLWGTVAVTCILITNFLIIVTEFIGVSLSLTYFGVSTAISVPIAAVGLFAIIATGSYRRWERIMFVFVVVSLLAIPLLVMSHPTAHQVIHGLFIPSAQGGFKPLAVLLVISIVGTTVAPWQLYFQQSNIVDKRITTRWLNYERADTIIGTAVVIVTAIMIVSAVAAGLAGTSASGPANVSNALAIAEDLKRYVGNASGTIFAILLLNASIIGAATVTLASSYAIGDVSGLRQSLSARVRDAKGFYSLIAVLIAVAAGSVLVSNAHAQGIVTLAVQALCGILLPATTVFALLLCNDREVLGPWANGKWLNLLALAIVLSLFVLSATLMATTVLPSTPVVPMLEVLGAVALVAYAIFAPLMFRRASREPEHPATADKVDWRTPRLTLMTLAPKPIGRRVLFGFIGLYLAVSSTLLVVRVIRLIIG
jgi:NRAMP (natural resistance-associated macrophage protein)-like metal ion transporter